MSAFARLLLLAGALLVAAPAPAQQHQPPNGLLLIAKPPLPDPYFRRTVVLVTQAEDGSTVGVILNRPTKLRLSQLLSGEFPTENYREPVFFGGPVMRQAIVALFRSDVPPAAPAFHVLKGVYLTMHADIIQKLLADSSQRYRIYAGFAGWAPGQLANELGRDDWFVLPADEKTLFRKDTESLWEELVRKSSRTRPQTRAPETEIPAQGRGANVGSAPPGGA